MKHCVECNVVQTSDNSYLRSNGYFKARCNSCNNEYQKLYRERNVLKTKEYSQNYGFKNRKKLTDSTRSWRKDNPDKVKAWIENNPEKLATWRLIRKYNRSLRITDWADVDKMKEIYKEARRTGKHVDHIIPLCGKLVSGLHVHNNLQLLSPEDNRLKSNSYAV